MCWRHIEIQMINLIPIIFLYVSWDYINDQKRITLPVMQSFKLKLKHQKNPKAWARIDAQTQFKPLQRWSQNQRRNWTATRERPDAKKERATLFHKEKNSTHNRWLSVSTKHNLIKAFVLKDCQYVLLPRDVILASEALPNCLPTWCWMMKSSLSQFLIMKNFTNPSLQTLNFLQIKYGKYLNFLQSNT